MTGLPDPVGEAGDVSLPPGKGATTPGLDGFLQGFFFLCAGAVDVPLPPWPSEPASEVSEDEALSPEPELVLLLEPSPEPEVWSADAAESPVELLAGTVMVVVAVTVTTTRGPQFAAGAGAPESGAATSPPLSPPFSTIGAGATTEDPVPVGDAGFVLLPML